MRSVIPFCWFTSLFHLIIALIICPIVVLVYMEFLYLGYISSSSNFLSLPGQLILRGLDWELCRGCVNWIFIICWLDVKLPAVVDLRGNIAELIPIVGYVAEIQIYLLTRGSRIRFTLFYIGLVVWSNLALRAMYQFYTLFLVLTIIYLYSSFHLFFILLIFWKPLLLFSSMIFQWSNNNTIN